MSRLAGYERALLEALEGAEDARAVRARLLADPRAAPYRAHVEAMEPRMLEVALRLARRWVRRDLPSPSATGREGTVSFPRPVLVGVLSDPAALAPRLDAIVAARAVDWVELRFDQLARARWDEAFALAARLRAGGIAALGTLRLASDGGSVERDDEARVADLRALLPHVDVVDLELTSAFVAPLVTEAKAAGKRVIVSQHRFDGTPSLDELEAVYARSRALGPDYVKVATRVLDPVADGDVLADFLRRHRDGSLALIGMGRDAVALRMHLPLVGSALAYGYLDVSTAPGQVAAEDLRRHFDLCLPR